MEQGRTTFVVQNYLDQLAGASEGPDAELVISALLGRSARRLERLCATLLGRRDGEVGRRRGTGGAILAQCTGAA